MGKPILPPCPLADRLVSLLGTPAGRYWSQQCTGLPHWTQGFIRSHEELLYFVKGLKNIVQWWSWTSLCQSKTKDSSGSVLVSPALSNEDDDNFYITYFVPFCRWVSLLCAVMKPWSKTHLIKTSLHQQWRPYSHAFNVSCGFAKTVSLKNMTYGTNRNHNKKSGSLILRHGSQKPRERSLWCRKTSAKDYISGARTGLVLFDRVQCLRIDFFFFFCQCISLAGDAGLRTRGKVESGFNFLSGLHLKWMRMLVLIKWYHQNVNVAQPSLGLDVV